MFRPIFDALEKMSGKRYTSTLPGDATANAADATPMKTSGECPTSNIIEVVASEAGAHPGPIGGDDDED